MAMEDFRVDVVVGKGPGATAIPLEIPPFTLVGATTRAGLLPGPLRDRFGFTGAHGLLRTGRARAGPHAVGPAARRRRSTPRAPTRSPAARAARPASPTGCCAGSATTPRSGPTGQSTARWPAQALRVYEVDERGLDRLDRAVLEALLRRFGGGPVGLSHPRGRRRRGARDGRGGRRAVPGALRAAGPHPARPDRHRRGLAPPRSHSAARAGRRRRACLFDLDAET